MGKWISRPQVTGTPYTIIVFASRVQGNQRRTRHGSLCRGCDLTLEVSKYVTSRRPVHSTLMFGDIPELSFILFNKSSVLTFRLNLVQL